jgi:excisionase family DNA binding protein
VNARNDDGRGYPTLASSCNHEGHTSPHHCTDQQSLARFGRGLAAFLLHDPPRLLTVREVASVLGVSLPIVYRLCERDELAHLRVSNAIRISPSALIAYLERRDR